MLSIWLAVHQYLWFETLIFVLIKWLNSSSTYDLVIYSDFYWSNGDSLPVTQTIGTGLTGTIYVNREMGRAHGYASPLAVDPFPTDVAGPWNWYRIFEFKVPPQNVWVKYGVTDRGTSCVLGVFGGISRF